MDKKDGITLAKIKDHANTIIEACKDIKDVKEYMANRLLSDACEFNLLQIGELAHDALSEVIKEKIPEIPWPQIYGLRNRIVHGYAGVDSNIIFDTIKEDLPELVKAIEKQIKRHIKKQKDIDEKKQ